MSVDCRLQRRIARSQSTRTCKFFIKKLYFVIFTFITILQVCTSQEDECSTGEHDCSPNAECIDQQVGFTCRCKGGFRDTVPTRPGRVCEQSLLFSQKYNITIIIQFTHARIVTLIRVIKMPTAFVKERNIRVDANWDLLILLRARKKVNLDISDTRKSNKIWIRPWLCTRSWRMCAPSKQLSSRRHLYW